MPIIETICELYLLLSFHAYTFFIKTFSEAGKHLNYGNNQNIRAITDDLERYII